MLYNTLVQKHLNFLEVHLRGNAEFALIDLPVTQSGQRKFYQFTEGDDSLAARDGTRLMLQSFPDGNNRSAWRQVDPEAQYVSMTQRAVDRMCAGEFDKVVLARTKTIDCVSRQSLVPWYRRLIDASPRALVFVVSTKQSGLWIGATPELLVEKTGTTYRTLALAGTRAFSNVPWEQKEYTEHDHVVSYLFRELQSVGASDVRSIGPYDARYGSLRHLRTDVSFLSTLSIAELVKQLHPTPALCGYPKQTALNFIREHEVQPRDFYTGSMVIEHPNGDGTAYAFLRCGKLSEDEMLTLYAGCGIVSASDPMQELAESEAKIASILNLR